MIRGDRHEDRPGWYHRGVCGPACAACVGAVYPDSSVQAYASDDDDGEGSPATPTALVDINTASAEDLDALPGIGKARGEAIIKGRPYKGKDDLLNRHILPPSVYDGIKTKIIAKQG